MVCLGRPYHFKFFKDFLPQILFSPLMNILSQIYLKMPGSFCAILRHMTQVGTEQVDMAQVGEKNYSYLACGGFKDTSLMR